MKDYSKERLVSLVESVCRDLFKLSNRIQSFVTFIEEKDINGSVFANYDRKSFATSILTHFGNKKLRGPSQQLFTKILSSELHGIEENYWNSEKAPIYSNE